MSEFFKIVCDLNLDLDPSFTESDILLMPDKINNITDKDYDLEKKNKSKYMSYEERKNETNKNKLELVNEFFTIFDKDESLLKTSEFSSELQSCLKKVNSVSITIAVELNYRNKKCQIINDILTEACRSKKEGKIHYTFKEGKIHYTFIKPTNKIINPKFSNLKDLKIIDWGTRKINEYNSDFYKNIISLIEDKRETRYVYFSDVELCLKFTENKKKSLTNSENEDDETPYQFLLNHSLPLLKKEKYTYIDFGKERLRFIFTNPNIVLNRYINEEIKKVELNFLKELSSNSYPYLFCTLKNYKGLTVAIKHKIHNSMLRKFNYKYLIFDIEKAYYSISTYTIFSLFKEMMSKEEFAELSQTIKYYAKISLKYKLESLPIHKHSQTIFSIFLYYLFKKNNIKETNFYNFVDDFLIYGSDEEILNTSNKIKEALESVNMRIGTVNYIDSAIDNKFTFIKKQFNIKV